MYRIFGDSSATASRASEVNSFIRVPRSQSRHIGIGFDQLFVAIQVDALVVAGRSPVEIIEPLACGKQVRKELALRVLRQVLFAEASGGIEEDKIG